MLYIGIVTLKGMSKGIMYEACTLNGTVSDVYYNYDLNKCVLTTCVMLYGNISRCYYEAPNMTALAMLGV
jgi:hypothetical protein